MVRKTNIFRWIYKLNIVFFFLAVTDEKKSDETEKKTDDDAAVEDDKEEKKSKTKTVDKTVWDWELMNESKPIWQRK